MYSVSTWALTAFAENTRLMLATPTLATPPAGRVRHTHSARHLAVATSSLIATMCQMPNADQIVATADAGTWMSSRLSIPSGLASGQVGHTGRSRSATLTAATVATGA